MISTSRTTLYTQMDRQSLCRLNDALEQTTVKAMKRYKISLTDIIWFLFTISKLTIVKNITKNQTSSQASSSTGSYHSVKSKTAIYCRISGSQRSKLRQTSTFSTLDGSVSKSTPCSVWHLQSSR